MAELVMRDNGFHDLEWFCSGNHPPLSQWHDLNGRGRYTPYELDGKFYCANTWPEPLPQARDGRRVRLREPLRVDWLSGDPLPVGTMGTLKMIKPTPYYRQPVPVVFFDEYVEVRPGYETFGNYITTGNLSTVPIWLEVTD